MRNQRNQAAHLQVPWSLVIPRTRMGSTNANTPATRGGRIPLKSLSASSKEGGAETHEMALKVPTELRCQAWRKGTKAVMLARFARNELCDSESKLSSLCSCSERRT